MQFHAVVKHRSFVWDHWRAVPRLGGKISGVAFRWDGKDYVTVDNPLPPNDVAALLHNPYVQLVMATAPVGAAQATEPQPQPEPEPQPQPEPETENSDEENGEAEIPMPRRRGRPPKSAANNLAHGFNWPNGGPNGR